MKILVLNGSPKRDKSDTMHITRAFLEGIPQKSHRRHTGHLDAVSQKKSLRNWQQRSRLISNWNTDYKD